MYGSEERHFVSTLGQILVQHRQEWIHGGVQQLIHFGNGGRRRNSAFVIYVLHYFPLDTDGTVILNMDENIILVIIDADVFVIG